MDLTALDGVDPEILARLPPFWQSVFKALMELREGGDGGT